MGTALGYTAGYRDDRAPGPRTQYGPAYYGGFLLDRDGNSVEAMKSAFIVGFGLGRFVAAQIASDLR